MKKKQIKVIYKNTGLANFFSDHIELNNKLKYNKRLRDYIIKHELGHKEEFDLLHEFKIDWKVMPYVLWFVLTTPSTWIDFSPVQYRDKQIIYDLNLSILYCLIIILLFIILKLFF